MEREMIESRAFWSLSGTAHAMLVKLLLLRDFDHRHNCLNKNALYLTYKSLENMFGESVSGEAKGISRSSIARGFTDLLAKGFIKVVYQGGTYKKDKTIYGLTDDWRYWKKGDVIRTKPKGVRASDSTFKKQNKPSDRYPSVTPPNMEPKNALRYPIQ